MSSPDLNPEQLIKHFRTIEPSGAVVEAFKKFTDNSSHTVVPLLMGTKRLMHMIRGEDFTRIFDVSELAKYNPNGILGERRTRQEDIRLLLSARQGVMSGVGLNCIVGNYSKDRQGRFQHVAYIDFGWRVAAVFDRSVTLKFVQSWGVNEGPFDSPSIWFVDVIEEFRRLQLAYYKPNSGFPLSRKVNIRHTPSPVEGVTRLVPITE